MADFKYVGTLGGIAAETKTIPVVAGGTSTITAGQLVTVANGYAALVADGGAASNGRFGLAISTSTETVGADGSVMVMFCPTGLLVEGTATTPGNLNLAAIYDRVTLDVNAGVQTVDENDANGVLTILPANESTNFPNGTNCVVSVPWLV